MEPWVVARIRHPRKAEVNVVNQGAEYYAPRALMRPPRGGPLRPALLFPGYAFVRHPEGRWTFLNGTFGVIGILMGTGERPAYLPDVEIARLRARAGPDGLIRLAAREFDAGEHVRVERGSISLDAIVESASGEDRIFVLMNVLGRWTRAEVDVRDLHK